MLMKKGLLAALFCSRKVIRGRGLSTMSTCSSRSFQVASWNIAAINNNPFEYWISHDDTNYNTMMNNVQAFIQSPGEKDVAVEDIFSEKMFSELLELMGTHGWKDLDKVQAKWDTEYKHRKIVSEFMKDAEIGNKRLASMPDRITNTINLANGSQSFRPTPINCYERDFASFEDWWVQWKDFMFTNTLEVKSKGQLKSVKVADMLVPISKAKYPAVTEQEEAISVPLQTLCCAIFDAILVHMLNTVAPEWQTLRHQVSHALNRNKNARTLEIIEQSYGESDVVFLQEVANEFVTKMGAVDALSSTFHAVVPETSGKRDQNSVLLLKKSLFDLDSLKDITALVMKRFEGTSVPIAEGDLVAVTVSTKAADEEQSQQLLLASFHGDTNGLATVPVVEAVHSVAQEELEGSYKVLFGLDANTYAKGRPGKTQDVGQFIAFFEKLGMASSWGSRAVAEEYTTFNARTYLQPQLNKAASKEEFHTKGDVNPKDFILFYAKDFELDGSMGKDNTGSKEFIPGIAFPTLAFPSDHAIIQATLKSLL